MNGAHRADARPHAYKRAPCSGGPPSLKERWHFLQQKPPKSRKVREDGAAEAGAALALNLLLPPCLASAGTHDAELGNIKREFLLKHPFGSFSRKPRSMLLSSSARQPALRPSTAFLSEGVHGCAELSLPLEATPCASGLRLRVLSWKTKLEQLLTGQLWN